jgi:AraC-like DNA-binding protein
VQRFVRLKAEHPEFDALELALEAGFGSYTQFFRVFRAVTGWTLSEHDFLLAAGSLPRLTYAE